MEADPPEGQDGSKVKTVMAMEVTGRRPVGRPKDRWIDRVKNDMREIKITDDDMSENIKNYREVWRTRIRATDPEQWD